MKIAQHALQLNYNFATYYNCRSWDKCQRRGYRLENGEWHQAAIWGEEEFSGGQDQKPIIDKIFREENIAIAGIRPFWPYSGNVLR